MYGGYISVWDGKDHKLYQLANGKDVYDMNILKDTILDIKNLGKVWVTSCVLRIVSGNYDTQIHGYLLKV